MRMIATCRAAGLSMITSAAILSDLHIVIVIGIVTVIAIVIVVIIFLIF